MVLGKEEDEETILEIAVGLGEWRCAWKRQSSQVRRHFLPLILNSLRGFRGGVLPFSNECMSSILRKWRIAV